jgi:hypothetical protein
MPLRYSGSVSPIADSDYGAYLRRVLNSPT